MKLFISLLLLLTQGVSAEIDWIDLPQADYHQIIGSDAKEIDALNELMDAYHALDKKALAQRIAQLESISFFLNHLNLEEVRSSVHLLNRQLVKKLNYLRKLAQFPSDEEIEAYHTSFLCRYTCHPLILKNELNYSLKMREFWGEFWLETADPCHRRLGNLYHHWLSTQPESKSYLSFFLWLETQWIDKHIPIVRYFDDRELEECRLTVNNGLLVGKNPLAKRNLFVIDLNAELFAVPGGERIWHSSLSRGRPVLGSGFMDIENGVIVRVSFESGHYQPSLESGYHTLQILREKGVPLAEPFEICYFEDRKKYRISISKNCLIEYNAFICAVHDPINRKQITNNEL